MMFRWWDAGNLHWCLSLCSMDSSTQFYPSHFLIGLCIGLGPHNTPGANDANDHRNIPRKLNNSVRKVLFPRSGLRKCRSATICRIQVKKWIDDNLIQLQFGSSPPFNHHMTVLPTIYWPVSHRLKSIYRIKFCPNLKRECYCDTLTMYDVTPSAARPDKKYTFHTLFRASNRSFHGPLGTGMSLIVALVVTAISFGCRHPFSWYAQTLRA